ncbi:MAG: hypothetical protein FRX49_09698 [Trebouxia sp. A1-2]|nr:MAG: hypothetical protein FRX49_09698 [Trebouxia sp. A1-2]
MLAPSASKSIVSSPSPKLRAERVQAAEGKCDWLRITQHLYLLNAAFINSLLPYEVDFERPLQGVVG